MFIRSSRAVKSVIIKEFVNPRFLKFCLVGAASFLFGFVIFNLAYALSGKLVFSSTLAYVLSVVNGFVLNRNWTFRDRVGSGWTSQAVRFAVANLCGYFINLTSYSAFLAMADALRSPAYDMHIFWSSFSGIWHGHARQYSFLLVNAAGVFATAVVILWNYLAHTYWSFRQ